MVEDKNKPEPREETWVRKLIEKIKETDEWKELSKKNYEIYDKFRLPHSVNLNNTIKKDDDPKYKNYKNRYIVDCQKIEKNQINYYNTDIAVVKRIDDEIVSPKLIIEAKYKNINTHDPITYSNKAFLHKHLFKGLRYGVIVGNYKYTKENGKSRDDDECYIPIRVLENSDSFDFVYFMEDNYNPNEIKKLIDIIKNNIELADKLEKYNLNDDKYMCIEKNIDLTDK